MQNNTRVIRSKGERRERGLALFRIHDAQRELIDAAAASTGVSRSEFMRAASLTAAREVLDEETTAA